MNNLREAHEQVCRMAKAVMLADGHHSTIFIIDGPNAGVMGVMWENQDQKNQFYSAMRRRLKDSRAECFHFIGEANMYVMDKPVGEWEGRLDPMEYEKLKTKARKSDILMVLSKSKDGEDYHTVFETIRIGGKVVDLKESQELEGVAGGNLPELFE